ncbi:MAG: Hydrolase MutT1 [Frankiales bacterium]|nr:Hydrolase MutT1 [Frankiales bacterium]
MKRLVRAAGGVLWRRADGSDGSSVPPGTVQVAVIHRPRYDDWSLPKGKLDAGETTVGAAVREVREETGFDAVVGRTLGESAYRVLDGGRDVPKTVRWWSMQATTGQFSPGPEVDRLLWLDVEAALRRVTGGRDSGPLTAFAQHPPETTTVLVVRHASAGRHGTWDGPDDERPLDARGEEQAAALRDALPVYGPRSISSAPAVRCRSTVQPLADRLSLPVVVDADLAEAAAHALPGRLEAIAEAGVHAVVCSQGGAIPFAVATLASRAGLELPVVPCAKGSVWSLSFSHGRLVDADYAAPLTP